MEEFEVLVRIDEIRGDDEMILTVTKYDDIRMVLGLGGGGMF